MLSSPDDERERGLERELEKRSILLALLSSLMVHLGAVVLVLLLAALLGPIVARLVPPRPELQERAALSDAITIEKRTVPREAHHAAPQIRHAAAPRVAALPLPTPAPLPRPAPPVRVPRRRPRREVAVARPTAQPQPPPQAESGSGRLSPQAIAALDARFARTISQAQSDIAEAEHPHETPSSRNRIDAIMSGTTRDVLTAAGLCYDRATPYYTSGRVAHYLSCRVHYSDGYSELAVFPWPFVFPRDADPMVTHRSFSKQEPPPGFHLPDDFELSRAVCTFYRARCSAKIAQEGDPTAALRPDH